MNTGRKKYCGDVINAEGLGDRGWFVGWFVEGDPDRKTDHFEIKSWHFDDQAHLDRTGHEKKASKHPVWEFTLILEGKGEGEISGETVTLEKWDYFLVPPGVCNNFPQRILEPLRGITVKAPSVEDSKKKCSAPL